MRRLDIALLLITQNNHDFIYLVAFSEKNQEVTLCLVIDGLKVEKKILKGFKNGPKKSSTILNEIFNEQSLNFAIEVRPSTKGSRTSNGGSKIYRLQINRLPTQINPDKTVVKVNKF